MYAVGSPQLCGGPDELGDRVFVAAELGQLRAEVDIQADQVQEGLGHDLVDEFRQFGAGHRETESVVVVPGGKPGGRREAELRGQEAQHDALPGWAAGSDQPSDVRGGLDHHSTRAAGFDVAVHDDALGWEPDRLSEAPLPWRVDGKAQSRLVDPAQQTAADQCLGRVHHVRRAESSGISGTTLTHIGLVHDVRGRVEVLLDTHQRDAADAQSAVAVACGQRPEFVVELAGRQRGA